MEDGIAGNIGKAGTDVQDRRIFSGFNALLNFTGFWVYNLVLSTKY